MKLTAEHMELQRRVIAERLSGRTRSERRAIERLEFVAVCLVGYSERVPTKFGQELKDGAWPVRVATTTKPRTITKNDDLGQPLFGLQVLQMVWTASDAHAKRLKAALDAQLLGEDRLPSGYTHNGGPPIETDNPRRLRHNWRSLEHEPDLAWPFLLMESLREIRKYEHFEVFDDDERQRRIKQEMLRG